MTVAGVVVVIVLVLVLIASAAGKLTHQKLQMDVMRKVGVADQLVPYLAVIELVGAAGLLVGLAVPWIGIAAAIGVVLYFVGAVVAHLRVRDRNLAAAGGVLVLSIGALVLRAPTF